MADLLTDLRNVVALAEKATPGPWAAVRFEADPASGVYEPWSPWVSNGGPRVVQKDKATVMPADDMAALCAAVNFLRDHGPALLALAEDAQERCYTKEDMEAACELAIAASKKALQRDDAARKEAKHG